jgi:hypothetical protein
MLLITVSLEHSSYIEADTSLAGQKKNSTIYGRDVKKKNSTSVENSCLSFYNEIT